MSEYCRDFGRPGCLGAADERYTMRFDDIGEPPIHWCAHCGAEAAQINDALTKAFQTGGEAFLDKFEAALDEAEKEAKANRS